LRFLPAAVASVLSPSIEYLRYAEIDCLKNGDVVSLKLIALKTVMS
jgi:hypothetical protein